MDKRLIVLVCVLLVTGMVLPTATVCAKKPDKPPGGGGGGDTPPTGTIYYVYNDGSGKDVWTMDADGSPKTELCSYSSQMASLSRTKHGSHYWFIGFKDISGQSYHDGLQRMEIFAIRDDNSKEVQLTSDAALALGETGPTPVWGHDDGYISWIAKRWVQTDTGWTLGKCGIWKQSIAFDANGDVSGLTGIPTLVWESTYKYFKSSDSYWPIVRTLDWSPDGNKIVFLISTTTTEIHIWDTTTDTQSYLAEGWLPKWSPDGEKIAFTAGYAHLKVINSDGTGAKTLVQVDSKGEWITQIDHFAWSPDSEFLSYVKSKTTVGRTSLIYKADIYFIEADGTGNTCISKDLTHSGVKIIKAWR